MVEDTMAQSVGMMGALRTGNPIVDMMIAMLVPAILKMMMDTVTNGSWKETLRNVLFFWSPYHTRDIEHKMITNSWGCSFAQDRGLRNQVLIKAIQLYLEHRQIEYRDSSMILVSTKQESECFWHDDDEGENTAAGKLKRFKVARKPPRSRWTTVSEKGDKKVELMVVESEVDKGEKAEKTQVVNRYSFRSVHAGAIDAFVDACYSWYIAELKKDEDHSRYLYEMQVQSGGSGYDESSSAARVFKRYKLSDEKTFSSLFFDEKEQLLKLLSHFQAKSGKYAVQGYPHKLGLLLHGPPGTGKTSLIKALAQYTNRSIVNVPLTRISTNQELMDMMMDQQFPVAGDDVPIKLGFGKVIFVMEDVDAASKVVQRRDGKSGGAAARAEGQARGASSSAEERALRQQLDGDVEMTPWRLLLSSEDAGVKALVDELMGSSERLKAAAIAPENVRATAAALRVPRAPGPTNDKERADFEKKSPAERVEAARAKAQEALNASCDRKERTECFVKANAATLKRILAAGGKVDAALEDELLGIAPREEAKGAKGAALGGYSGGAAAGCDDEDDEEGEGEEERAQMMQAMMMSMMTSSGGSSDSGSGGGGGAGGPMPGYSLGGYSGASAYAMKKDKLNLSGLLNVLDGVVDTPERIVIMTTNHPEVLDPALIRPGRIDKKLLLAHMKWPHVTAMISHYFQLGAEGLDEGHAQRVRKAIVGDDARGRPPLLLTPATVEQLSAEHDEVEGMVAAIEAMAYGESVPHGSRQAAVEAAGAGDDITPLPLLPKRTSSNTQKAG